MHPAVSAVISTYNRRMACERALESVLEQTLAPVEVLVCDDGSTDGTEAMLAEASRREPRVRHLRGERTGVPGITRNIGLRAARGEWIAFLDDDDVWLPGKLAAQGPLLGSGYAVVCANALRSDGRPYFDTGDTAEFGRAELLTDNPVIISTAVVRRSALEAAGGFPSDPALSSIEDYAAWLSLADAGARFIRTPEPLALYEDARPGKLSAPGLRTHRRMVRLSLRRWLRRPGDRLLAAAAMRHSFRMARVLLRRRLGPRSATSANRAS
jgi:teichuronic acid biosynthesis glycosyltransferase TuaG